VKRFFVPRKRRTMAIRCYRKPLPYPVHYAGQPNSDPRFLRDAPYEDIFVIMDRPLLEFNQKDLALLRGMKIDPFIEVE
jgi:hypothetical protein